MPISKALVDERTFHEHKALFLAFLQSPQGQACRSTLRLLATQESTHRLLISVNDLRSFDPALAQGVMHRPLRYYAPWEEAIRQWVRQDSGMRDILTSKDDVQNSERDAWIHIGFVGNFGSRTVTPRQLRSKNLGEHVCVTGIITHCSLAMPKILRSVHWCRNSQEHISLDYRDATCLDSWIAASTYKGREEAGIGSCNNLRIKQRSLRTQHQHCDGQSLQTEFGLGIYADHQCLTLQELPEAAPHGQLPRSVDVIVDDDLVEITRPGDRVRIAGVYRPISCSSSDSSIAFRAVLIASSVSKDDNKIEYDGSTLELHEIMKAYTRAVSLLFTDFAPSIHGLDIVKFGLIMQLVGGCEKILASGSRLRGDINILLLGDPSTAKSQLLRATMRSAPLAISTTGRGSSGVGLTAAISHDKGTGERHLQAGATVLADRGIVCIDEFDKMAAGDRVAIHEVMEQQTVTLAKAGIHASLNARCSILAAANPIYGKYDSSKRPQENIGLPDSLLSRFDLIFLLLDGSEVKKDRSIAEHVLSLHRKHEDAAFCGERTMSFTLSDASADPHSTLTEKIIGSTRKWHMQDASLRRFVLYARNHASPILHTDARNSLANSYADLRSKADERTLPVTARCLESLIRLATAHAKLRLSDSVLIPDCVIAHDLVSFALHGSTMDMDDPSILQLDHVLAKGQEQSDAYHTSIQTREPHFLNQTRRSRAHAVLKTIVQSSSSSLQSLSVRHVVDQANWTRPSHEPEYTLTEIEDILSNLEAKNLVMYDKEIGGVLAQL